MLRILIAAPVLFILIVFALSNQQVVRLGLWPTDFDIDLPVSVAMLLAAALFFIAGGFMTWGTTVSLRQRARRAERSVRQLEAQVQSMKERPGTPAGTSMALPPPGA